MFVEKLRVAQLAFHVSATATVREHRNVSSRTAEKLTNEFKERYISEFVFRITCVFAK